MASVLIPSSRYTDLYIPPTSFDNIRVWGWLARTPWARIRRAALRSCLTSGKAPRFGAPLAPCRARIWGSIRGVSIGRGDERAQSLRKAPPRYGLGKMRSNYARKVMVEGKGFIARPARKSRKFKRGPLHQAASEGRPRP